ncbi:hypothetical protein H257_13384 [Aphanomyces astaci]|uniref:Uncharacterized protein n=1 Tax=Aphanomyces astaci TaxID=112090 RepID=W4FWS3_APHAT|nr:hypothetical protein H257_13384 [Aphanomyces astaci]ETV71244.1 hypothetical protein H257_13384 [Aphanomyces astaci]|eukprot:XP_009839184.1 hypothetical protein H257_13384 [Aphanomyces astaci]
MAFAMMVATNGDRFPRLPTFMVTATALGGYIAPLRQDPSLFIYCDVNIKRSSAAANSLRSLNHGDAMAVISCLTHGICGLVVFILARYVIFPGIRYVKVSFWLGFYFAFFGPDVDEMLFLVFVVVACALLALMKAYLSSETPRFSSGAPRDYLLSSSRSATYYGATVALLRLATELSLQILAVPDPSCLNQRSRPFRLCNPLHLPVCVTTL